jgi:hypothetical protein
VKKPNVSIKIWIEAAREFQVKKKIVPFETKASSHVALQSFDSDIMDSSTSYKSKLSQQILKELEHYRSRDLFCLTFPICMSHVQHQISPPSMHPPLDLQFHDHRERIEECHEQ